MHQLHDNTVRHRYELEVEGQIVFADYRRDSAILHLPHVEAPPALRGTGAAGRLMQALVAQARAQQLRIAPSCAYAAAWIRRHPEHHDVLV